MSAVGTWLILFVEESSVPTVTFFNSDPNNHPYVIKFFNSKNAKGNDLFEKLSTELIVYIVKFSQYFPSFSIVDVFIGPT
jgi:hypothetical protein